MHIIKKYSKRLVIQTDNGVEFSGITLRYENNYFIKTAGEHNEIHKYIFSGHCNANADMKAYTQ